MSIDDSILQLLCKFFASDIIRICEYPSVCRINCVICNVKVFVQQFDHALFFCLVVCVSICLVIVFSDQVANNEKVLDRFLLSGIFLVVCLDHCFSKSIVTGYRRMSAKTVTNNTSAKETEKSGDLSGVFKRSSEHFGKSKQGLETSYVNLNCLLVTRKHTYIQNSRLQSSNLSHLIGIKHTIVISQFKLGSRSFYTRHRCCKFKHTYFIEHFNLLCSKHSIRTCCNSCTTCLKAKVIFDKYFYLLRSKHSIRTCCNNSVNSVHNCCNIRCVVRIACSKGLHYRTEHIVAEFKIKNRIQRNRTIRRSDHCLLESKVNCDRNCLGGIRSRVSSLLRVRHILIVKDLSLGYVNNRNTGKLYSVKKSPNHSGSIGIILDDGLIETVTNDRVSVHLTGFRIDKIVTVSINDTFYVCSLSIVEGCLAVNAVLRNLHVRRKCSNERVQRRKDNLEHIANGKIGEFRRNAILIRKRVHKSNKNHFRIRIQLKHCLNRTCVVQNIANSRIYNGVNKSLILRSYSIVAIINFETVLFKSCKQLVDQLIEHFLLLRIKLTDCILNIIDHCVLRFARETNSLKNSTEHEYAEVTVAHTKRNDISLSNALLVHLSNYRKSFQVGVVVFNLANAGITTCIDVGITKSFDICSSNIETIIVHKLKPRPIVTVGEYRVPKFSIPTICLQLVDYSLNLFVLIINLKQPMQILSSHRRHSELSVINLTSLCLAKPLCKLICIGRITVVSDAVVTVIAFKTITVRHRITQRYIINVRRASGFFFTCNHSADHRRTNAKHHYQGDSKAQNLKNCLFHFHFFLSNIPSQVLNIFLIRII